LKLDTEQKFNRHNCVEKIRSELLSTPLGFNAFNIYNLWLQARKLCPKDKDVFISSKYFNAFIRFVEYQKKQQIPKLNQFIEFCVGKVYEPYSWCSFDVYQNFINEYIANLSPMESFYLSVETIDNLAEKFDLKYIEVFEVLPCSLLIKHVASYNISPWYILNSQLFSKCYNTRLNSEQKMLLNTLIPIQSWNNIFAANSSKVSQIKKVIAELEKL